MHRIETRDQLDEFKTVVVKLPRVLETICDKKLELMRVERAGQILHSHRLRAIDKNRTFTPYQYIDEVTRRLDQTDELKRLQSQSKSVSDELLHLENWIKTYVPWGIWFKLENFVFGVATSSGKVHIIPQYGDDNELPELGGHNV